MATKKAKAKPKNPTLYFVGWGSGCDDPYEICKGLAEATEKIEELLGEDIDLADIECYKLGKEMKITRSEITLK